MINWSYNIAKNPTNTFIINLNNIDIYTIDNLEEKIVDTEKGKLIINYKNNRYIIKYIFSNLNSKINNTLYIKYFKKVLENGDYIFLETKSNIIETLL